MEIAQPEASGASVFYLPVMLSMVCFINISLKSIAKSGHTDHYGRFGLGFSNAFRDRIGVKSVHYYSEGNVLEDPLIKEFNRSARRGESRKDLQTEIVSFRKPMKLSENFKKSTVDSIKRTNGEMTSTSWTYDRYEIGYNFSQEKEWRTVLNDDADFVSFKENELLRVLVPNSEIQDRIASYFSEHWTHKPVVKLCP